MFKLGVFLTGLSIVLGAGCDLTEVGMEEEAILNGIPFESEVHVSIAKTKTGRGGSGTLIRNDVVITARHLFTVEEGANGPLVDIDLNEDNGDGAFTFFVKQVVGGHTEVRKVERIIADGPIITGSANQDVAVVKLVRPFEVGGIDIGHSLQLSDLSQEEREYSIDACAGWGITEIGEPSSATFTKADLMILPAPTHIPSPATDISIWHHSFMGRNMYFGDSGTSCFQKNQRVPGIDEISMVQSGGDNTCAPETNPAPNCVPEWTHGIAASVFRSWVRPALDADTGSYSNGFGGWSSDMSASDYWTVDEPAGALYGPSRWYTTWPGELHEDSNIGANGSDHIGSKLIYNGKSWGNASVEVSYWSTDDDAVGLILRYVDSQDYYRFSVDQSRHTARIVRVEDGQVTTLTENTNFDILHSDGHTLKFMMWEKSMAAFVDDRWILYAVEDTDSPNYVGRAGIYEWWLSPAKFDDFKVEPIY